jgi:hypothetical protein
VTTHGVIQMSGGIGSWNAGFRVKDQHQRLTALFCDVGDGNPLNGEDADVAAFARAAAADIGADLVWLNDGRSVWDVFRERRWLGNSRIAACSVELKAKPARAWVEANCDPADTTLYVGIDWTERERLDGIRKGWAPWTVEAPLCEPPYTDKQQMILSAKLRGLAVPAAYALGFGHANCGGTCVKGGQAAWRRALLTNPERYAWCEDNEEALRADLGDVSILRDRRDGNTVPLTLREFRLRLSSEPTLFDALDEGACGCIPADAA